MAAGLGQEVRLSPRAVTPVLASIQIWGMEMRVVVVTEGAQRWGLHPLIPFLALQGRSLTSSLIPSPPHPINQANELIGALPSQLWRGQDPGGKKARLDGEGVPGGS